MSVDSAAKVRYGQAAGRWVLLATVLGSGLAFIDATVVNIALPQIGERLHADAAGLQWTVNGYTLSLASLILLGGSLGDRYGRRRIFIVGIGWFAVASLLCGIAPNIEVLIAARVLQGIGGALLAPGSLAIIESSFESDDRARAIGAWSGLGGVAGAIAPFLGGWLVEAASWRLVFLINVPLAIVVVLITMRHVPESRNPDAARKLDFAGFLSGAVGLGGLTYGFTAWPAMGPGSPVVISTLLVGVAGLVGFGYIERRSHHPMLPLEVFRSKTFSAANVVTFAVYAALSGVFFLVVLNLQVVTGYRPIAAGTALLPVTLVMLLLSARAGQLGQRIGPRVMMTVGPLICAVALVPLALVGRHVSYWWGVLPAILVLGVGLATTVAPLTATALGAVDSRHAGVASGVNNAVARAAGLLSIAILPLAAGIGTGSLTDPKALGPAYKMAIFICVGLMVAGAVVAFLGIPNRLPRRDEPAESPTTAAPTADPATADLARADPANTDPASAARPAASVVPAPGLTTASTPGNAGEPVRYHCSISGPPLLPHGTDSGGHRVGAVG